MQDGGSVSRPMLQSPCIKRKGHPHREHMCQTLNAAKPSNFLRFISKNLLEKIGKRINWCQGNFIFSRSSLQGLRTNMWRFGQRSSNCLQLNTTRNNLLRLIVYYIFLLLFVFLVQHIWNEDVNQWNVNSFFLLFNKIAWFKVKWGLKRTKLLLTIYNAFEHVDYFWYSIKPQYAVSLSSPS